MWLVSPSTDGINGMRYDAVAWDGRPFGFELKPKASGDGLEVRDERSAIGTEARFGADR